MQPTTTRDAELIAMFDRMDFGQMAAIYEVALANGDADLVAALDRYNGQTPAADLAPAEAA